MTTRPLLAKKKKEPVCPTCKRRRPDGWLEASARKRSLAIKRGLAKAKNKGRPRKTNYQKIYKAIDKGLSMSQTQLATGATKGTIQHALRIRGYLFKQLDETTRRLSNGSRRIRI